MFQSVNAYFVFHLAVIGFPFAIAAVHKLADIVREAVLQRRALGTVVVATRRPAPLPAVHEVPVAA